MDSFQDSIENCSICQNSRKKNFLIAPHNYANIFGYIGPASKSSLNINKSKKPKHSKKHLKQSTSKLSNQLYYPRNLDINRDKSQVWFPPGRGGMLYNFNAHCCDETKMRYDESDTDFTDFEDLKCPRVKPKLKAPPPIKKNQCITKKHKSKTKPGKSTPCKTNIQTIEPCDSDSGKYACPPSPQCCNSADSLRTRKPKKKKLWRKDSEDSCSKVVVSRPTPTTNYSRKRDPKGKRKVPCVGSNFSIDSTQKINRPNRLCRRSSRSSMKMRNLKTTVNKCGSIESVIGKRRIYIQQLDPEDRDQRVAKRCKDPEKKRPVTAITNSDISANSGRHYFKKKTNWGRTSTSSTNLTARNKYKSSFYGSVESIQKYTRKIHKSDAEDEMLMWGWGWGKRKKPCVEKLMKPCRKPSKRGKSPSVKSKRKRKKVDSKCCFICMDQEFNFNKT